MSQSQPPLTQESLNQLSKAELVKMLLAQQKVIAELLHLLQQKINKLKLTQNFNSKTSSKPLSTDLLKKSEQAKHSENSPTSDQTLSLQNIDNFKKTISKYFYS